MKILLTTLVFPYPINDGGKSGTFRMVDSLRGNNEVTFICPQPPKEDHLTELKKLWPDVNIVTFLKVQSVTQDSYFVDLVKRVLGRKVKPTKEELMKHEMLLTTCNLVDYYFENLLDIFRNELAEKKYDLVQIDFIELAPLVHFIPKGIPKVFVHHEIRFKRMERELATVETPEPGSKWKMANSKMLELDLINLFDKVICLTETDRLLLIAEGISADKIETSPLPMVVENHSVNQPFVFQNHLIFLGPDQHYPNLDGLDWFLKNCWVNLKQKKPDLKMRVVGKWSAEKRSWFKDYKDVIFEGFVQDLKTVMNGAVMIVPLRIGSGMRMKILEGVSFHVPIVSTTIGAEGLPMENDVNCKIADSPADYVKAISEVIDNPDLQNQFTVKASSILNVGYSSEECSAIRESIFNDLIHLS